MRLIGMALATVTIVRGIRTIHADESSNIEDKSLLRHRSSKVQDAVSELNLALLGMDLEDVDLATVE